MSTAEPASGKVCVRDLTKRYGSVEAVRGVSFDVNPGEIFGLLGPNGAGKTTTLECLLGLRGVDSGSITIGDIDARAHPARVKELVGAQLQTAALQDKITAREALTLVRSFYPAPLSVDGLLERFALTDKARAPFASLSGGQKQRLLLALAFVNNPRLVVLDEPTAGLDPQSRRELHRLITSLRDEGKTVLLSTHLIEEAHQLCDRIGILHHGQMVAMASPSTLIAQARALPRLVFKTAQPLDRATAASLPAVTDVSDSPDESTTWVLSSTAVSRTLTALVEHLSRSENSLLDLQIRPPSLEDVFIELTGAQWTDSASDETAGRRP